MSNENQDWIEAVTKLIQLTQEKKIKWQSVSGSQVQHDEDERVDVAFSTEYKGQILRLYSLHYQAPSGTVFTANILPNYFLGETGGLSANKSPIWTSRVVLEFIDSSGTSLFKAPSVPPLNDLLQAVGFQVSGASDFLKSILAEGS